jgi:hypothetical protein
VILHHYKGFPPPLQEQSVTMRNGSAVDISAAVLYDEDLPLQIFQLSQEKQDETT